ncbi:MAG: hypothetical protein AB2417_02695 [Clostridiaceae bacterium]
MKYPGIFNFIKMISSNCDKLQEESCGCSSRCPHHKDCTSNDTWEDLRADLYELGFNQEEVKELTSDI